MKALLTFLLFGIFLASNAQETTQKELPYTSIPEAPDTYTPGTVVSRMIDGLGFRYRWATEDLREDDLAYEPGNDGRTIAATMDHLHGLSLVILRSAEKKPRDFTTEQAKMTLKEKRLATLQNFEKASGLFKETTNLKEHPVIFIRENGTYDFPFWNNINGPIEDAIWHAGQVVVLRRSAGNPINPKVNVFLGKLND